MQTLSHWLFLSGEIASSSVHHHHNYQRTHLRISNTFFHIGQFQPCISSTSLVQISPHMVNFRNKILTIKRKYYISFFSASSFPKRLNECNCISCHELHSWGHAKEIGDVLHRFSLSLQKENKFQRSLSCEKAFTNYLKRRITFLGKWHLFVGKAWNVSSHEYQWLYVLFGFSFVFGCQDISVKVSRPWSEKWSWLLFQMWNYASPAVNYNHCFGSSDHLFAQFRWFRTCIV